MEIRDLTLHDIYSYEQARKQHIHPVRSTNMSAESIAFNMDPESSEYKAMERRIVKKMDWHIMPW